MRAGDILGGKYVLEHLLGKGGMGVVWAAYDAVTRDRVAVKLIIPQNEDSLTKELRQRLLREAGACAKLRHPNIIQVYDVGETDDDDPYLVLELLEGQPLGDLLKQKRKLEPKLAARIAADIASGLSEAHAAAVVHRDLKPANIFLHREQGMAEGEFVTKVLDFGVCIDRGSVDTVKTRQGIAVGSPAYMSPEQVGTLPDIDGRTDIWSLGVLLYEMVTGMRVFSGTVTNVMAQILTQPVPAPSSKVRDVPPGLDAVVARCTQMKKEMRYAEAGELARELYRIAGARPAVRHASSSRPALAKPGGLPGMAAMFDAEIHATPVVPQPGSARTFNPMGATLPLMTAERRPDVEKLPPVMDEVDDLAATMPLQPKLLSALRPKLVDEATNAAMDTQLLRKDAPVPSPEPAWKQEMQRALEVHRQSSAALPTFVADAPNNVVGGTLVLSVDALNVRLDAPIRSDATGTTSTASSMSQEIRLPLKSRPEPVVVVGRRRRQTQKMLFAAGGFLVASVVLLLAVLLSRRGAGKATAVDVSPNPSSVSVPRPSATVVHVVPVPSGQTPSEVPKDKPSPVSSAPVAAPDAGATNNVRAMSSAKAETKLVPATTARPYKTPGLTTAAPAGSTCTGIGVFKRCK